MRTEQQHLDLVLLHHLVPLQLVLDLLVSLLPLLIFSAHSATHLGGFLSIRICITRKGGVIIGGVGGSRLESANERENVSVRKRRIGCSEMRNADEAQRRTNAERPLGGGGAVSGRGGQGARRPVVATAATATLSGEGARSTVVTTGRKIDVF